MLISGWLVKASPVIAPSPFTKLKAPEGNFGSADGITGNNHAVHPTKMIFIEDAIRMGYGAEEKKPSSGRRYPAGAIGLMELRIGR